MGGIRSSWCHVLFGSTGRGRGDGEAGVWAFLRSRVPFHPHRPLARAQTASSVLASSFATEAMRHGQTERGKRPARHSSGPFADKL